MATVLVVEDEPLLLTLLSDALRRSGHTAILAESGEEALRLLQADGAPVSAVVADFSMPGISGIQMLRAARILRPKLKAILVSGYWIEPLPSDLDVEYMMKPFSPSKLVAKLDGLITGIYGKVI